MAIFRNMCDPNFAPQSGTAASDVMIFECNLTRKLRRLRQTGKRFDQLSLTVTLNTSDADNLPATHFKRNGIDSLSTFRTRDRQSLNSQSNSPDMWLRFFDAQEHFTADHQTRQFCSICLFGL